MNILKHINKLFLGIILLTSLNAVKAEETIEKTVFKSAFDIVKNFNVGASVHPYTLVEFLMNNKPVSLGLAAMTATATYLNWGKLPIPHIDFGSVRRWTRNAWSFPAKYPALTVGILTTLIANETIKLTVNGTTPAAAYNNIYNYFLPA